MTEIEEAVEKKDGKAISSILMKKRWCKAAKTKAENEKNKKKDLALENSEWLGKVVRVTPDVPEEGRCGAVMQVTSSGDAETVRLHLFDEGLAGGTFAISSEHVAKVERRDVGKDKVKPFKLDWRTIKALFRENLRARIVGDKDTIELMKRKAMPRRAVYKQVRPTRPQTCSNNDPK